MISGGFAGSECATKVYMLDTGAPPTDGSSLPVIGNLNTTGAVAVATSMEGKSAGFFDGETLDIFALP